MDTLLNIEQWTQYPVGNDSAALVRMRVARRDNVAYGVADVGWCLNAACNTTTLRAVLFKINADGSGFQHRIVDTSEFPGSVFTGTGGITEGDDTSHFYANVCGYVWKVSNNLATLDTLPARPPIDANYAQTPLPTYWSSIARYAPGHIATFTYWFRIATDAKFLAAGSVDFNASRHWP